MEASIRTLINHIPWLSPTVYNRLLSVAKFKVDILNLYIRVRNYPTRTWVKLPFIATNDAIFEAIVAWPPKWRALDLAELEKIAAQERKKEIKLRITKLAERTCQEQKTPTQWEAIEAAVDTITAPAEEIVEEISMDQDIQGEVETQERTDLTV